MSMSFAESRLLDEAESFLRLLVSESVLDQRRLAVRLDQIARSVAETGTYDLEYLELEHACRVAWRNSDRCIGRLPWKKLTVIDCRHVRTAEEVFRACISHLRSATNHGHIRPMMSVFAPVERHDGAIRILNPQLIRYAGWRQADGTILGDPLHLELTEALEGWGWRPASKSAFTVLPVAIQIGDDAPRLFDLPADAVLEVPISHPDLPWFADLGLRWHAVPMLTGMMLEAGGLHFTAAPFNGWYMGTEIGARNLGDEDRYNQLRLIAHGLKLNTHHPSTLWQDRALVELNVAVISSFKRAQVTIVDHHCASHQFMTHIDCEARHGRVTAGDWSWLVPPISGSTTPVFHRYYPQLNQSPRFLPQSSL